MTRKKFDIDLSILDQANKCDREFACLWSPCDPSCEIKQCINGKVHFVKEHKRNCPYFFNYGFNIVCSCPVRKEIFNKYGV